MQISLTMVHADLHIHSDYSSDGEFSLADIVAKCLSQNTGVFSLTDHNSVRGIDEAMVFGQRSGIDCIPGLEIDCNYEGVDLHLLGYNIDWRSRDFITLEEGIFSKVMDSFAQMIGNLHRLGFVVDADAVLSKANGKLPTGELIAEVMLSDEKYDSLLLSPYKTGGHRDDMPYINFYLDYFAQGKPAFVPINYMSFQQAVELVKDNGGVPVVAHPGLNLKGKEEVVEQLLTQGAAGLEVFNNYHDMEQIGYFASLVQQRNRIMTCGSDFHGKTKPLIQVGRFRFDSQYETYLNQSIQLLKTGGCI